MGAQLCRRRPCCRRACAACSPTQPRPEPNASRPSPPPTTQPLRSAPPAPTPTQDAEEARRLFEGEGAEALLLPCDLSEGEETCKALVDKASVTFGEGVVPVSQGALLVLGGLALPSGSCRSSHHSHHMCLFTCMHCRWSASTASWTSSSSMPPSRRESESCMRRILACRPAAPGPGCAWPVLKRSLFLPCPPSSSLFPQYIVSDVTDTSTEIVEDTFK